MAKTKSSYGEIKSPKGENQVKTVLASEFGVRLRAAAENINYNQTELAYALSLPTSSMGRYWHGERLFPSELLFRAADCLSVDPRWLATGISPAQAISEINATEQALLADFRSLPKAERQHVLQSAAILAGKFRSDPPDSDDIVQPTLHSPAVRYKGQGSS